MQYPPQNTTFGLFNDNGIMESWRYVREENGLEWDVIDSATDPLFIGRHPSFGWESRNPSRFNENIQLNKITNNMELKFPDKYKKKEPDNPICDLLDGKVGVLPSPNAFLGEDESTSKLSGSILNSNSKDFPLSDLKLGRFADLREAHSSKLSNEIFHMSESVVSQKRARVSKLNSQIAFCQVYGCNKDLSSSKDYHKKHKVCESHTKTAKVIVNGIEQRFCQQCSRFHLIAEFDDAKRSCQRRLAGHNERRRKSQVGLPSGTKQRYLQSYDGFAGTMHPRTTSTGTSLIFQDGLPSGFLHSKKSYGMNDWFKPTEVEGNNSFTSSTITPMSNGHFSLKPRFASYDIGAQNGPDPFDIGGFCARPWSPLLHNSSACVVFDAESMVHDLPRISNPGCAHSLLSSSQPHDSSYHFPGLSMLVREASTIAEQCQVPSPILASENNGDNFQINQGFLGRPEFQNVKDCFSWEQNPTIGLRQLSSQFQRLEDQKAREARK